MKIDTVNPMPARAAMPSDGRPGGVVGQHADPEPDRQPGERGHADQLADDQPEQDTVGDRRRRPRPTSAAALSGTPALASANSGTITKLVHGCSRYSSHSTTDTDSRARVAVSTAASDDGDVDQLRLVDELSLPNRASSASSGPGPRRPRWRGARTRAAPATSPPRRRRRPGWAGCRRTASPGRQHRGRRRRASASTSISVV